MKAKFFTLNEKSENPPKGIGLLLFEILLGIFHFLK